MVMLYVETDSLKPNPDNMFDPLPPDEYQDLKLSISKHGIRDALIICRNTTNGDYTIICGHNRHRAAKELSLHTLPCVLVRTDEVGAVLDTELYRRMLTKEQRKELIAKKNAVHKAAIEKRLESHLHPALKKLYDEGVIASEIALHLAALPASVQAEAFDSMEKAIQETVIIEPADPEQEARHAQKVASIQAEVETHKATVETLKTEMKDMERKLRELKRQKDKARELIEDQQENIARLKEQSFQEARESLRAEVEKRIEETRQQMSDIQKAMGEKDIEIERLNEEIEHQKRRVWDTETLVKSAEVSAKMFKDDCVAKLKLLYSPKIIKTSLDGLDHALGGLASYLSSDYAWDPQTLEEVNIRLRKHRQRAKEVLNILSAPEGREPLQLPNVTPMLPEDQQKSSILA